MADSAKHNDTAHECVVAWKYNLELTSDSTVTQAWTDRPHHRPLDEDESEEEDLDETLMMAVMHSSGLQWDVRTALAQRAVKSQQPGAYLIHPADEDPKATLAITYMDPTGTVHTLTLTPTKQYGFSHDGEIFSKWHELQTHCHLSQPLRVTMEPCPFQLRPAQYIADTAIETRPPPKRHPMPDLSQLTPGEERGRHVKNLFNSPHLTDVADPSVIKATLAAAGEGSYLFTPTDSGHLFMAELLHLNSQGKMEIDPISIENRGYTIKGHTYEGLEDLADDLGLSQGLTDELILEQLYTDHTIHEAIGSLKGQPNGHYILAPNDGIPLCHYIQGEQVHTKDLTIEAGELPIHLPWDRYGLKVQVLHALIHRDLLEKIVSEHDRQSATDLLRKARPGEFILRHSSTPNRYTLSVKRRGNIEHLPLTPSPNPNSRRVDVDGTLIAISRLPELLELTNQIVA